MGAAPTKSVTPKWPIWWAGVWGVLSTPPKQTLSLRPTLKLTNQGTVAGHPPGASACGLLISCDTLQLCHGNQRCHGDRLAATKTAQGAQQGRALSHGPPMRHGEWVVAPQTFSFTCNNTTHTHTHIPTRIQTHTITAACINVYSLWNERALRHALTHVHRQKRLWKHKHAHTHTNANQVSIQLGAMNCLTSMLTMCAVEGLI